jgi:hypothetical protein
MPPGKHPSSYRLSEECRGLIEQLSAALGISQTGVIEQAVRKLARAELPPPSADAEQGQPAEEPSAQRKGRSKPKGK